MKQCKTCIHEKVCEKAKHIENYRFQGCEHYKNEARFIELPCAVGDTVYPLNADRSFRAFIERIEITADGVSFDWVQYDVGPDCTETWDDGCFSVDDIGKTVFLDETEYLKSLAERSEGK
jgi:hypothetical protein